MSANRSGFFNSGGMTRSVTSLYPDPWVTISSTQDPQTTTHMLRMSERLLWHNPILSRAYKRVIAFMVTKIEVSDCSDEEKKKYLNFLHDELRIISIMHAIAYDYLSVGNSFCSIQTPFTRMLMCMACRQYQCPIDKIDYEFNNWKFYARCPKCKRKGEWHRWEIQDQDHKKLKVRRWSPHEIEIKEVETTKDKIYFWKMNPTIKDMIKKGDPDYMRTTPWVEVECVKQNAWMRFKEGKILHLYQEPPAGYRTGAWGLSDSLMLRPELYQYQVCRRHNESICHESIIPMKFLSPVPVTKIGVPGTGNSADPSMAVNLGGNFVANMQQAMAMRRRDPYGTIILPHGVSFQQLGGDAKNLIPKDIMDQTADTILNSAGVPVDFYKATFTTQGAPMALRAVQSSWSHLNDSLNRFLDYVMTEVSKILQTEPAQAKLAMPVDVDDINRIMARLNLMQAGKISDETGLASIGADAEEELERQSYGQIQAARKQKEMQKTLEREGLTDMLNQGQTPPPAGSQQQQQGGQGGQPQQQGGPPPIISDPNTPISPVDQISEAQAWASYLVPLSQQNRQAYLQYMLKLRTTNPALHNIVTAQIEQMRNQAAMQGRDQVIAQQGGAPA